MTDIRKTLELCIHVIQQDRDSFFDCHTIAGDRSTLSLSEAVTLAQYDTALAAARSALDGCPAAAPTDDANARVRKTLAQAYAEDGYGSFANEIEYGNLNRTGMGAAIRAMRAFAAAECRDEREACAKVAERTNGLDKVPNWPIDGAEIAAAIRARGS